MEQLKNLLTAISTVIMTSIEQAMIIMLGKDYVSDSQGKQAST
jgi:hypothetical protein